MREAQETTNVFQSTEDSQPGNDVRNFVADSIVENDASGAIYANLQDSEQHTESFVTTNTDRNTESEAKIEEKDECLSVERSPVGGGSHSPSRRRDELRAKLRQSEERILKFTRTGDGRENILGQMVAVTENLKKVEEEKNMLETELAKLQQRTDERKDVFLQEKMSLIQEGFHKQVETIQGMQEELAVKDDEIASLREDLVKKLRRIVELEFDLETHSVHFTNYAKEQFKLGKEALAEIKGQRQTESRAGGDASVVSTTDDASVRSGMSVTSKKGPHRKAQKLISKLLADLDDLEKRYKADRLDAASELHRAEMTMEHLRTRIQVYEQQQANTKNQTTKNEQKIEGTGAAFVIDIDAGNAQVQVLRKRNQTLEARKMLAQREIERLQTEIIDTKNKMKEIEREFGAGYERYKAENDTLRVRIAELESAQQKKGIMQKMRRSNVEKSETTQFTAIDAHIKSSYERIAVLEAERSVKDRQISALKNEVVSLRMKEIASGSIEQTNFTESDSDLLRSPTGKHRMYDMNKTEKVEGVDDSAYVEDLQSSLQEAQQLLVKKDQELVVERAKSASTIAGLLARITELTGNKADSGSVSGGERRGEGKHRFYL